MKPRGFVPVPSQETNAEGATLQPPQPVPMQILSDPILFELCICGVLLILVGILFVCFALIAD